MIRGLWKLSTLKNLVSSHSLRNFSTRGMGGVGLVDITSAGYDDQEVPRLSVRGFGESCFQVNETLVHGSVIILPHSYYIWEATKFEDITKESLALFTLIHPTIEVLFLGCGDQLPRPLDPALVRYFKQKGIILEASSSTNAAATFNVLNGEGRNVACALLGLGPQESSSTTDRYASGEKK